jgi:O-antigen chain-terminating methyltransferase
MLVAEDRKNLTTLLQTTEDLEKRFEEVERRFHEHLTAGLKERDEKIYTLRRSLIEEQRKIRLILRNQGSLPPDAASSTAREPIQESDPFFSLYADFEDAFRGLKEEVKEGLRVFLPFVQSLAASHHECRVLDLGCGRGEWLELLRYIGVKATGVDVNPVFIDELRENGLDSVSADAFSFLKESGPSSYTAVTAFHLIEHLPPASRIRLLDEIYRVLVPGGMAVLETPNPRNILVGSGDFYRDPSHINPVFPDTLAFIAEHLGFVDSVVYFFKDGRKGLIPSDEYRFDTLDDYIKVSRDYVWIGRKPS